MIRALNTAGLSDLEKRVVKATYDDDDPPKQKHVEALILLSADHELVPFLDRRVVSPQWNVCLKCLSLIHKLSLEADERFLTELQSAPTLLTGVPQHFDTSVDPTATAHARFIHSYAAYLQAKMRSFEILHLSCERQQPAESKRWVMRMKVPALVRGLPLLQKQFDALLVVQPANSEDMSHPIPIACMTLAIKDAFRLYSVLTVMMLGVLERYESMTLAQTERMLAATHKFLAQNTKFRKWADKLCKNGFVDRKLLPKFDAIPVTFLQLLEEHIVELGGVVSEPTPTPSATKQRSPRSAVTDNTRIKSPKQRAAKRREMEDEAEEEDEAEYDTRPINSTNTHTNSKSNGNTSKPTRASVDRKQSSQARVSGVGRQQSDGGYRQDEYNDGLDEMDDEQREEAAMEQARVRQPRRSSGGMRSSVDRRTPQQSAAVQGRAGRASAVSQQTAHEGDAEQQLDDEYGGDGLSEYKQQSQSQPQPQPQPQPQRVQRPVNGRVNPPTAASRSNTTVNPTQRRGVSPQSSQPPPPPRSYDDEQQHTDDDSYPYNQPTRQQQPPSSQRRDMPHSNTTQRQARPTAATVRPTQLQSQQRPIQQPVSGGGHRNTRQPIRQEPAYDQYDEHGQEEVEGEVDDGSHVDAADDPLALYMQSAAPIFPSSSSKQQQLSIFSSVPPSSRPSNPTGSTASRSAAKARVAAVLSSELNLFDNFDPLTLHPAEQRALDRQQADMQAAFFTNPPPISLTPSLQQPPPPAYEVEPYDTNDEGMEHADDIQSQNNVPSIDLFSDLTAKLSIDDSDHPPPLPAPVVNRFTARQPVRSTVARSTAASSTQRSTAAVRTSQQAQTRPPQRQTAAVPVYDDADEEEDGSEPNFM